MESKTCPTRPPGDVSNAQASTEFVANAISNVVVGGNTRFYDTVADVLAATVPAFVNVLWTGGYYEIGKGQGMYVEVATPATNSADYIYDSTGRCFRLSVERPNPYQVGAFGDDASHPASSIYATLADAQEFYPACTALTEEIDALAISLLSDQFDAIYILPGRYYVDHVYTDTENKAVLGDTFWPGTGGSTSAYEPAALLIGVATDGGSVIRVGRSNDAPSRFIRIAGIGISLDSSAAYDYFMEIPEPTGCGISYCRLFTDDQMDTGGIKMRNREVGTPGTVFSNHIDHVFIRLPGYDAGVINPATMPLLNLDISDSQITNCYFTGGTGIDRYGSGAIDWIANRIDHSIGRNFKFHRNEANWKISDCLMGNLFEQCVTGQIDVIYNESSGGTLESYVRIIGNLFWTPPAGATPSPVWVIRAQADDSLKVCGTIVGNTFNANLETCYDLPFNGRGWTIAANVYDIDPDYTSFPAASIIDRPGKTIIDVIDVDSGTPQLTLQSLFEWAEFNEINIDIEGFGTDTASNTLSVEFTDDLGATWFLYSASAGNIYEQVDTGTYSSASAASSTNVCGSKVFPTTGRLDGQIQISPSNLQGVTKQIECSIESTGGWRVTTRGRSPAGNKINGIRLSGGIGGSLCFGKITVSAA